MAKTIDTILNRFDAGIVNDKRTPLKNACRVVTNADILTTPFKILPHRDSEDGDSAATTSLKRRFTIALRTGTTYSLYALGVKSGAATAEVLYKNLTTGAATDLDDNGWDTPSANQSASGAVNYDMFDYYQTQGLIYGFRASGRYVWAFSPTGTAWADSAYDYGSSTTHRCGGVVHPKDDIHYFGMDNKVIKNNAGSFSVALTLPANLFVASVVDYGNFLAIGCQPLSGTGKSIVYLWNRNDSLSTLTENFECQGLLQILDVVDGALVAVSYTGNQTFRTIERVLFTYYTGKQETEKIMELVADDTTSIQLLPYRQHQNNRLYFMMSVTLDGTTRDGVWSFGRSASGQGFALSHERTPNNDTALSSGVLYGFYFAGDYLFQSFSTSSTHTITKTNDSASYTATTIYETIMNPDMDSDERQMKKQLIALAIKTEPLPSGAQVVVKYKVDGDSSFSSALLTHDTADAVAKDLTSQWKTGRDFQFRLELTGGAVITSFRAKYKEIKSNF